MLYLIPSPDGLPWLTLLVLSPLLGILLVALAGPLGLPDRTVKLGVVAWMSLTLALALRVWGEFDYTATAAGQGTIQFAERVPWVQAIKVNYFLGVDGLSMPLVLLTAVLAPIAALASFGVKDRVRLHLSLLLLLQSAMLGYFVALDFFFFFIFWEFSLVPAYFLIALWGGEGRRPAALTFFIYTMAGSVGLLLLFQVFYQATLAAGIPTFDIVTLGRLGRGLQVVGTTSDLQQILFAWAEKVGLSATLGRFPLLYTSIAFWAIFVAFGIKLAVWPFHTWLPDAYSEAPTAGSIMLSAVMSKMGAYGLLRIMLPLVPEAAQYFAPVLGALALATIVAGAFGALANNRGDLKRLIGYTSINHMGYVLLAIAAAAATDGGQQSRTIAINGALMQMVAHGLSTGALFLLAGALYARTGTYRLADMGGLRTSMPLFAGVMGMAMFANLGLPGLAGFVGEFFIFRGAWAALPLYTFLATLGLVITALALLLMFQRIFLGPAAPRRRPITDLSPLELWTAGPLLVLALLLGIFPGPIFNLANATAAELARAFVR